jgi:nucleoid DNA-binding protein
MENSMTKQDLIIYLANHAGFTTKAAKIAVNTMLDGLADGLAKDGDVLLGRTLRIKVKDIPAKPERQARNPKTGERVTVKAKPATKKVVIRPLSQLKSVIK